MREITFNTTCVLWLHLESYHNAGIKPERSREIIEKLTDPGSAGGMKLRCEAQGINHNWNVLTQSLSPRTHDMIADAIQFRLEAELTDMRIAKEAMDLIQQTPQWWLFGLNSHKLVRSIFGKVSIKPNWNSLMQPKRPLVLNSTWM